MINIERRSCRGRVEVAHASRGPISRSLRFCSPRPWSKGGRPSRPPPLVSPLLPSVHVVRVVIRFPAGADTHNVLSPGKYSRMYHKSTIPHTTLLAERASLSAFSEKRFQASRVELADLVRIYASCSVNSTARRARELVRVLRKTLPSFARRTRKPLNYLCILHKYQINLANFLQ